MNIWKYYIENKSNPNWVLHIKQQSPSDFALLKSAPGKKWPEKAWNFHHGNIDVARCSCGNPCNWYQGSYTKRCSVRCSNVATAETRRETFAKKPKEFWEEVATKCSTTNIAKYGEGYASKRAKLRSNESIESGERARKQAMLEKYGVTNPIQVPGASKKRASSMLKWKDPVKAKDRRERQYATRVKNGHSVPNDHPSIFGTKKAYTRRVRYLTNKIVEDLNLFPERSKYLHIDHMFSILDGFRLGVNPEILAHPKNLRLLSAGENSRKNSVSSISLSTLLDLIEHSQ